MAIVGVVIGAVGLVCILYKRSILGILTGVHLLAIGASVLFVASGLGGKEPTDSHSFGLFICLGGLAQLVTGYALAVRVFYLKKKTEMDQLQSLRH